MSSLRKIKLDGHVVAINSAHIVSAVPDISMPAEEPRVIVETAGNAKLFYAGTLDEFLADIGRVEYMPAVVGTDAKPYRVIAPEPQAGDTWDTVSDGRVLITGVSAYRVDVTTQNGGGGSIDKRHLTRLVESAAKGNAGKEGGK